VLIATGPNWHAAASILAANAGKDVYCEKPCTKTIAGQPGPGEGVSPDGRVFKPGTQRRRPTELCLRGRTGPGGQAGKTSHAPRATARLGDRIQRLASAETEPAKEEVDWDTYLGPAAWRPYNKKLLNAFNFEKGGGFVGGFGAAVAWNGVRIAWTFASGPMTPITPPRWNTGRRARNCTRVTPMASSWCCATKAGCHSARARCDLKAKPAGWKRGQRRD